VTLHGVSQSLLFFRRYDNLEAKKYACAPPPSKHLGLFRREQQKIPATTESYRVYVGTGNNNSNSDSV
jgi:hypothetical protein